MTTFDIIVKSGKAVLERYPTAQIDSICWFESGGQFGLGNVEFSIVHPVSNEQEIYEVEVTVGPDKCELHTIKRKNGGQ